VPYNVLFDDGKQPYKFVKFFAFVGEGISKENAEFL
jgi:hypothetical protein